jgi:hypothetical protein
MADDLHILFIPSTTSVVEFYNVVYLVILKLQIKYLQMWPV